MSNTSTFIGDTPADTLNQCADIAAFVGTAVPEIENAGGTLQAREAMGLFWIMQAVESALRFEAGRVMLRPGREEGAQ